jgi:flagellar protein FlaJ
MKKMLLSSRVRAQLSSHIHQLILIPKNEFKNIYDESGISTPFNDYIKKSTYIFVLISIITIISSIIIHKVYLQYNWNLVISGSLSILMITNCSTGLFVFGYPVYKKNQEKLKVENGLVYTLSHMAILSTSGMAIENIFEQIVEVEENPSIRSLAKKFIMDLNIFGYDVPAALEDISNRTASEDIKKILNSITNNIQTSGDLYDLLRFEVENQLQIKKDNLKKFMGSLTYLGEIYVALLIMAPILFIVMITILSVLGGGSSINTSIPQLLIIVFFGIPVLATGFIIILDTMIGGDQ